MPNFEKLAQSSAQQVTHNRLLELLAYDPEGGTFRWRVKHGRKAANSIAGTISKYGYRIIGIDARDYRAARIAWLYVHGAWPSAFVDHINGRRSDDRLDNLREATRAQNNANSLSKNRRAPAPKGAHFHRPSARWTSSIQADGISHYLGMFGTASEAAEAYAIASRRLHGLFARSE